MPSGSGCRQLAGLPAGVSQRPPSEAFAPEKLGSLYRPADAPPVPLGGAATAPGEPAAQTAGVAGATTTAEQAYLLDVSGWMHVPGALSPAQVAAAAAAPGDWSLACSEPRLESIVAELLGEGYRLDIAPGLLPQLGDADADAGRLHGGGWSEEGRRLRYWDHHSPRRILGVRVVVALADVPSGAGGLTLLAASHKSTVSPPTAVLDDAGSSIAAALLDQPAMAAGDALLLAGSLARGLWPWCAATPQLLLGATFASSRTFPAAGYSVPPGSSPSWLSALKPEQLSVTKARFTGVGGATADHGYAEGGMHGERRAPQRETAPAGATTDEHWFWDLSGILILRGVMDEEWLAKANAALDKYERDPTRAWTATDVLAARADGKPGKMNILDDSQAVWAEGSSDHLLGRPRPRLGGLYELPSPDCIPFRRMLAHKPVDARLRWILGPDYHETQEPIANIWPPGTGGFSLHDDPGLTGYTHAVTGDGRVQCDQVNVQWTCGDVTPDGGGFAYIPGSHKALLPLPVDERISMDMRCVRVPQLNAGDVLLFGGVTHGAMAWREDQSRSSTHRRAVIHFYNSKHMSLGPGNIVDGAAPRVAPPARL